MYMYEQEENVRRSHHPNIASVIGYALLGLPFAVPGVSIAGNILTALFRPSSPPPDPGMLFALVVLGGIGGVSWWVAYKRFRRWRAYAPSHLRLETAPVPLGKSTRARLEVRVPADEQPPDGFQVRIFCEQEKRVLWEDSTSASGPSGPSETNVPLLIDLPAAFPDGQMKMTPSSGTWKIEATASFDDKPDYEATFFLPVRVPYDHDERVADDAAADGSISSPESVDLDPETDPADGSGEEAVCSGGDGEPEDEPTEEAAPAAPTDKESAAESSVPDDPNDGSEQIPTEEATAPEDVPPAGEVPSSEEPGSPQKPAPSSDAASPPESEDEPDVPEFAANTSGEDAFDDSFGDDREADRPRDRTRDSDAETDTVQCDNCSSTVRASASTCPACGADLDSGWFS